MKTQCRGRRSKEWQGIEAVVNSNTSCALSIVGLALFFDNSNSISGIERQCCVPAEMNRCSRS